LYMEGNDFTGWPANFALTVRNQGQVTGCDSPWSVIRHVTFKSNRIGNLATPHTVQLFNLQMEDNICTSSVGSDVKILNNLFTSGGWIADLVGGSDITIRHNTVLNDGAGGWANGRLLNGIKPVTNLVFADNVAYNNEYGLSPQAPYNWGNIWPAIQMTGNVVLNEVFDPYRPNCSNLYPVTNFCPATRSAIGFTNMANGNYRLSPSSPYRLSDKCHDIVYMPMCHDIVYSSLKN